MSYISTFIDWCQLEKKEAGKILLSFLLFFVGIMNNGASLYFMIIPLFFFFLTQYFYHVWCTQYVDIYYKISQEEKETLKSVGRITEIIPVISFGSAILFNLIVIHVL